VRYDLREAIASIRHVAERNGGEIRAESREPATGAEVRACEEHFGYPLPPSQREFLSSHNGVLIRAFGRHGRTNDRRFPYPAYRLDLFGTAEILARARDLEETFAMYCTDDLEYLTPQRARSFVGCAAMYEGDPRIVLASDRLTADGEFAVIGVNAASTDWVAEGTEDEPRVRAFMESHGYPFEPAHVLASSFGEFVERSLRAMIEHERGFDYTAIDDENLWEKR